MLANTRIGAIFHLVSNIDRTEAFYRDTLGLAVQRMLDADHGDWLEVPTAGNVSLLFFRGAPKIGNSPIMVFELADGGIDRMVSALAERGATLVTPISEAPGGWSAELADPDGMVFSFFQPGDKPR
jgi:glyoxylase I family protein